MDATEIQHGSGEFEADDGTKLAEQWWKPAGAIKAAVVVVHGLVDYSDRYAEFAQHLVQHGYAVYALDLRGHGRSGGDRSYVDSIELYLEDLDEFLARVRDNHPEEPLFLFGHSMGGAIATLYVIDWQPELKGLILSGAGLKEGSDVSPLLKRITPLVGKVVPHLPALHLDIHYVSRDPAVVKSKEDDPLIEHRDIPARTGAEILGAIDRIQECMPDILLPLLIMHGTADRWTNPEGSKELAERAGSPDKTLKLYEGFYHEILTDPEKAAVMNDVVGWLDAHVK